jgi:hypothetical protein
MKTNRRIYLFLTAVVVMLQLSFGFQSASNVYADSATPTPTAQRGTCTDMECG